jgi:hypothetical protein
MSLTGGYKEKSEPRGLVKLEGLVKLKKNVMASSGLEPLPSVL